MRKGRRLQAKHLGSVSKWAGTSGFTVGVLTGAVASASLVESTVTGGAVGGVVAAACLRKPSGAANWIKGAKAERRTARVLRRVERRGWAVLHDRAIPRSKANLDHVLVTPSGRHLVYVDTKAWHAKGALIRWVGDRLMYGPWDRTGSVRTVQWEASRLAEELDLPVTPVIAVDGGRVARNVLQRGGVFVVRAEDLDDFLITEFRHRPDPSAVSAARRAVNRTFPPAR